MTAAQTLRPLMLLTLIAVSAGGGVLTYTPFPSMVPDLVDRAAIPAATALLAIAMAHREHDDYESGRLSFR